MPAASSQIEAVVLAEELFDLAEPCLTREAQLRLDSIWQHKSGLPLLLLMEQAAGAVFHFMQQYLNLSAEATVYIACGSGLNGGDGWALACHLLAQPCAVVVLDLAAERSVCSETALLRQAYTAMGGCTCTLAEAGSLAPATILVDAILGTAFSLARGLSREIIAALDLFRFWQSAGAQLVALDIPTGIEADSGRLAAQALLADYCVSFVYPKQGLWLTPAALNIGKLFTPRLSFNTHLIKAAGLNCSLRETSAAMLAKMKPPRRADCSKADLGHCLLLVGSQTYPGAALLAAEACLRSGVGYVCLQSTSAVLQLAGVSLPELLLADSADFCALSPEQQHDLWRKYQVLGVGSGWSGSAAEKDLLQLLLHSSAPLIIDATALRLLSQISDWQELLRRRSQQQVLTLLTPHQGELAELLGAQASELESSKLTTLREFSARTQSIVLFKGYRSLIVLPDGRVLVNPSGNNALARAGTGDVLLGLLAGLVAQGLSLAAAAVAGAYIHGLAAEKLSAQLGSRACLSSELGTLFASCFQEIAW